MQARWKRPRQVFIITFVKIFSRPLIFERSKNPSQKIRLVIEAYHSKGESKHDSNIERTEAAKCSLAINLPCPRWPNFKAKPACPLKSVQASFFSTKSDELSDFTTTPMAAGRFHQRLAGIRQYLQPPCIIQRQRISFDRAPAGK